MNNVNIFFFKENMHKIIHSVLMYFIDKTLHIVTIISDYLLST